MARPHLRDPQLERFWRTTIARWANSPLTIRDFCQRHRLHEPSFYHWRREIAARDGKPIATRVHPAKPAPVRRSPKPSLPSRPPTGRTPTPTPRPSFVALRVVADAPLELLLRTGHTLRIPPGYDAAHLRAVVTVLEAQPC